LAYRTREAPDDGEQRLSVYGIVDTGDAAADRRPLRTDDEAGRDDGHRHGRPPDRIGGPWNVIPMRLVIQERGSDPALTPDEQLVYDAILREGRLPGGAVRLVGDAHSTD
jgi:hypothetical protein